MRLMILKLYQIRRLFVSREKFEVSLNFKMSDFELLTSQRKLWWSPDAKREIAICLKS